MRWRILLLQLSFSKRRLRRILREAGGDASIRYSHFLAPDNARLAAWLYAGSIVGFGAVSLFVELPVLRAGTVQG